MAKSRTSRRSTAKANTATEPKNDIAKAQEQSMTGPQEAAAEQETAKPETTRPEPAEQSVKTEAAPKKKAKLFSEEAIDTAVERSEKYSEFLPDAPPGAYPDSIFVGAEMQMSKAKQPMIVITVDVDDKYAEIKEFNVFPETNEKVAQVSQNKIVDFMLQAFAYKILPADGEDMVEILNNIIDQMNKFAGKKLAAAVQGEPDVYIVSNEDGSSTVKETLRARLWYVRKEGTPLNFNATKAIKKLSASEQQKIQQRNAGKITATEPVQRPLNEAEIAEIKENPLLNEAEKASMIDKGITEGGSEENVPAWARS